MKYTTLIVVALLLATNSFAKGDHRNTADVALQIGGTFVNNDFYDNFNDDGVPNSANIIPAINFIYDYNFDKSRRRVFFSLGARVETFSVGVSVPNPSNYFIEKTADLSSIGFGIAPGLNYLPLKTKSVQLRLQLCAVPMIEAGSFRETVKPNVAFEGGLGVMFKNKVGIGVRFSRRLDSYIMPNVPPYYASQNVSHLMLEFRFRIRK